MSRPRGWSLLALYVVALAAGALIGRAPLMLAGMSGTGTPAWIGSLIGMCVVGFAFMVRLRVRVDDLADAAAALAHTGAVPSSIEVRGRELERLLVELHGVQARMDDLKAGLLSLRHEQDAVMESVDGGVLALDREQRILNLNKAAERMLGFSGRDIRGSLLQEVTRYASLNRFVSDAIASPGLTEEFQLEAPISGGGRIGFSMRASSRPLRETDGAIIGLIVFLTDVTRLRRLEAVRSDFAANVSHELRTPITNIRGYVETLLETPLTDRASTTEFLRIVQRNAQRLSEIVDDMLALTNLERPDMPESLHKNPTRLDAIIRPVLELVEKERSARGTRIICEGDASLQAMVSGRLAEQALGNLVSNAVRYSPEGSTVIIRAAEAELPDGRPGVELAVIDRGPGISAEHLPRLFERFYRVDKARSREQGGTGLGLSIVKHIALAHGGKVTVESTPGQGSTFRLRLPAP